MTIYFFFDFLSPYSYLASELLARDLELDARLTYTPVVFGTMLSRRNAKGPGEDRKQREVGLQDIMLRARFLDIPFEGTPTHPFNPLPALRSVTALTDNDQRRRLTRHYFRLGWRDKQPLDDLATLRRGLAELGIDQDPDQALSDPTARKQLKAATELALEAGATGVPTFLTDGILFFGGDRIDLLKSYLAGQVTLDRDKLAEIMARPGIDRVV
ncbi:MAG: DsbA family protein [Candidatus Wallbacteria bacterium]|nr:DsbA family protein [Candidatus Wallbacteria bacterium]